MLTDYRLCSMDASRFEKLLSTLASGRSPVGLAVLKPEAIARRIGYALLRRKPANLIAVAVRV